jgi:hypothetical protein
MYYKFLEILEIPQIFEFNKDIAFPNLIICFKFRAFSDNIGIIVNKFIDLFSSEITEGDFNYSKLIVIEEYREKKRYFISKLYIFNILSI